MRNLLRKSLGPNPFSQEIQLRNLYEKDLSLSLSLSFFIQDKKNHQSLPERPPQKRKKQESSHPIPFIPRENLLTSKAPSSRCNWAACSCSSGSSRPDRLGLAASARQRRAAARGPAEWEAECRVLWGSLRVRESEFGLCMWSTMAVVNWFRRMGGTDVA